MDFLLMDRGHPPYKNPIPNQIQALSIGKSTKIVAQIPGPASATGAGVPFGKGEQKRLAVGTGQYGMRKIGQFMSGWPMHPAGGTLAECKNVWGNKLARLAGEGGGRLMSGAICWPREFGVPHTG